MVVILHGDVTPDIAPAACPNRTRHCTGCVPKQMFFVFDVTRSNKDTCMLTCSVALLPLRNKVDTRYTHIVPSNAKYAMMRILKHFLYIFPLQQARPKHCNIKYYTLNLFNARLVHDTFVHTSYQALPK